MGLKSPLQDSLLTGIRGRPENPDQPENVLWCDQPKAGLLLPCPPQDAPDELLVGAQTSPWRVHPGPHWRMTMAESGPPPPTPLLKQSYCCPGQKAAVLPGRGREMGHQGAGSWSHWEPVRGGKKVVSRPPVHAIWSHWLHLQSTNSKIKFVRIHYSSPSTGPFWAVGFVGLRWLQPMRPALDTSDLTRHGAVTQWSWVPYSLVVCQFVLQIPINVLFITYH